MDKKQTIRKILDFGNSDSSTDYVNVNNTDTGHKAQIINTINTINSSYDRLTKQFETYLESLPKDEWEVSEDGEYLLLYLRQEDVISVSETVNKWDGEMADRYTGVAKEKSSGEWYVLYTESSTGDFYDNGVFCAYGPGSFDEFEFVLKYFNEIPFDYLEELIEGIFKLEVE